MAELSPTANTPAVFLSAGSSARSPCVKYGLAFSTLALNHLGLWLINMTRL